MKSPHSLPPQPRTNQRTKIVLFIPIESEIPSVHGHDYFKCCTYLNVRNLIVQTEVFLPPKFPRSTHWKDSSDMLYRMWDLGTQIS